MKQIDVDSNSFSIECNSENHVDNDSIEEDNGKFSDDFVSSSFGLTQRAVYNHGKKNTNILSVTYNSRLKEFAVLDSTGIVTWQANENMHNGIRVLHYEKYNHRLYNSILFVKKYHCYLVLSNDYTIKVLNRDFEETCNISSDLRCILFMAFNPIKDELIIGGIGGAKVWVFARMQRHPFMELKPMANYELKLKRTFPGVTEEIMKRVELNVHLQHIYFFGDTDVHCFNTDGALLFKLERAHVMSISGCVYSPSVRLLVTSSVDMQVKVWTLSGRCIHIFRGHSKAITQLILHPESMSVILTCSLDGSIRMWSLDTMEALCSMQASTDGILWMEITEDKFLYTCTSKVLTLWNLNNLVDFWAYTRSQVIKLSVVPWLNTKRIVSMGEDNSMRLFSFPAGKNVSTILPPPALTPLQRIDSVTVNPNDNVVYVLLCKNEIWIYGARTSPACRIAVWDLIKMQEEKRMQTTRGEQLFVAESSLNPQSARIRSVAFETVSLCTCILYLPSKVSCHVRQSNSLGTIEVTPDPDRFLLLGLQDGRILFMDAVIQAKAYIELVASRYPIIDLRHDARNNRLIVLGRVELSAVLILWRLPLLELASQITILPDVTCYAIMDDTIFTGHQNGMVYCHSLNSMEQRSSKSSKSQNATKKADHNSSVTAMDANLNLNVFLSCSSDGVIKVWDSTKTQLAEIVLDNTLSYACFLGDYGDMLVGFKNHLFKMHYSVYLTPSRHLPGAEEIINDDYQPPYWLMSAIDDEQEKVTLENYLVPFDIKWAKRFLEGMPTDEESSPDNQKAVKEEQSDTGTVISNVPTDFFDSPPATPDSDAGRLSRVRTNVRDRHQLYVQLHGLAAELQKGIVRYELPVCGESPISSPVPPTINIDSTAIVQKTEKATLPIRANEKENKVTGKNEIKSHEKATVKSVQTDMHESEDRIQKLRSMRIDSKSLMMMDQQGSHTTSSNNNLQAIGGTNSDNALSGKRRKIKKREGKETGRKIAAGAGRKSDDSLSIITSTDKMDIESSNLEQPSGSQEPEKFLDVIESNTDEEDEYTDEEEVADADNLKTALETTTATSTNEKMSTLPSNLKSSSSSLLEKKEEVITSPTKTTSNQKQEVRKLSAELQEKEMEKVQGGTIKDEKTSSLVSKSSKKITPSSAENKNNILSMKTKIKNDSITEKRSQPVSESQTIASNKKPIVHASEGKESARRVSLVDEGIASNNKQRRRSSTLSITNDFKRDVWTKEVIIKRIASKKVRVPTNKIIEEEEPADIPSDTVEMNKASTDVGIPDTISEKDGEQQNIINAQIKAWTSSVSGIITTQTTSTMKLMTLAERIAEGAKLCALLSHETSIKELQEEFWHSLNEYQSLIGTHEDSNKFYQNDGKKLDDRWAERAIERHKLLRIQRELRARSAHEKRHQLENQRQEKIRQKLANSNEINHDASLDRLHLRIKSAPVSTMRNERSSGDLENLAERSYSAADERITAAALSFSPSPTLQTSQMFQSNLLKPSYQHPISNDTAHRLESRPITAVTLSKSRPVTALASGKTVSNVADTKSLKARSATPYRQRMFLQSAPVSGRQASSSIKVGNDGKGQPLQRNFVAARIDNDDKTQPTDYLTTNTRSFLRASKSIPEKCRSYALVRSDDYDDSEILPSRLEQQLIQSRFPKQMDKWLGDKLCAKLHQQQLLRRLSEYPDGVVNFLPVVNLASPNANH